MTTPINLYSKLDCWKIEIKFKALSSIGFIGISQNTSIIANKLNLQILDESLEFPFYIAIVESVLAKTTRRTEIVIAPLNQA
jgi:hypothetical protein